VHPAAERQVRVVRPLRPEHVRVGEPARVTVAGGQQQRHVVAGAVGLAGDLDVRGGPAADQLHRRVVPQHLLHECWGQLRMRA
jgi:hypothetical protein